MKPIVYLAAYCGRWYSAKLNKAHTILISSFVIFRVLSNMTDVMQMFQTKYQLQVRATQNKRSYFVPFIEEMDHQSTKKLTRKSESMETSLPQAATPSSSIFVVFLLLFLPSESPGEGLPWLQVTHRKYHRGELRAVCLRKPTQTVSEPKWTFSFVQFHNFYWWHNLKKCQRLMDEFYTVYNWFHFFHCLKTLIYFSKI